MHRGFHTFSHLSKNRKAKTILLGGGVIGLAFAVSLSMLCLKTSQSSAQLSKVAITPAVLTSIRNQARSITVRVVTENGQGSGILVRNKSETYTVLTNQHVILSDQQITVQTADAKQYPATMLTKIDVKGNDLAVIQFKAAAQRYPVAVLGKSSDLQKKDRVFASGFPNEGEPQNSDGFRFTEGKIALFAPQTLQGGYQMGYTNEVVKGMSGGPVLNALGQLVGVNGMHAYPLWGDPYVYLDGTRPEASLQKQMIKLSWAIPIETVMSVASDLLK